MPVGIAIGVIALLGVTSIYFWVVRRSGQEQNAETTQR
jgi:hypothetical protein